MPSDRDALVFVANVRAISDGLALMCELEGRRRVPVPKYSVASQSEVRKPGDFGTLILTREMAERLEITALAYA